MLTETNAPHRCANPARAIVDKFGGATVLAKESGISRTTILSWCNTGIIPEPYRIQLLLLAKRLRVPHKPADYIEYLVTALKAA